MGLLSFELVWENQVGVSQHISVNWDYVFVDVEFSLVAHDRIKNCLAISQCLSLWSGDHNILLQKNDPGFIEPFNFRSLAIEPMASTASAPGA